MVHASVHCNYSDDKFQNSWMANRTHIFHCQTKALFMCARARVYVHCWFEACSALLVVGEQPWAMSQHLPSGKRKYFSFIDCISSDIMSQSKYSFYGVNAKKMEFIQIGLDDKLDMWMEQVVFGQCWRASACVWICCFFFQWQFSLIGCSWTWTELHWFIEANKHTSFERAIEYNSNENGCYLHHYWESPHKRWAVIFFPFAFKWQTERRSEHSRKEIWFRFYIDSNHIFHGYWK